MLAGRTEAGDTAAREPAAPGAFGERTDQPTVLFDPGGRSRRALVLDAVAPGSGALPGRGRELASVSAVAKRLLQRLAERLGMPGLLHAVAPRDGARAGGATRGGAGRGGDRVPAPRRDLAAVATVARRLFGHEVIPVRFTDRLLFNGPQGSTRKVKRLRVAPPTPAVPCAGVSLRRSRPIASAGQRLANGWRESARAQSIQHRSDKVRGG